MSPASQLPSSISSPEGQGGAKRTQVHQVKEVTANLPQITGHMGSDRICKDLRANMASGLETSVTRGLRG